MSKLNSLSPGFLSAYYRNQSDEVKQNVRIALGAFVNLKLNSSTRLETEKEKSL